MDVGNSCYGLFVDINDNLYCSLGDFHQIVMKSFDSNVSVPTVIAGIGCPGIALDMLYNPHGIFVDINFDLYVADFGNNRIQVFPSGQTTAITRAGTGASETISLNRPTSIVLDADGYLFIVEQSNHRVVGSGPNGFRCLFGCSLSSGSASDQLNNPFSLSFDSYGNIFVTDVGNYRTQKFLLATNSCGKLIPQPF